MSQPQPPTPPTPPSPPPPGSARFFTLEALRALAARLDFPDPALAAAVAMAESGDRVTLVADSWAQGDPHEPSAQTPHGAATSFGLWQVNHPAHPEFDPTRLLEAEYNGRAALLISHGGTTWSAWSTFTSGAYKAFLGESA